MAQRTRQPKDVESAPAAKVAAEDLLWLAERILRRAYATSLLEERGGHLPPPEATRLANLVERFRDFDAELPVGRDGRIVLTRRDLLRARARRRLQAAFSIEARSPKMSDAERHLGRLRALTYSGLAVNDAQRRSIERFVLVKARAFDSQATELLATVFGRTRRIQDAAKAQVRLEQRERADSARERGRRPHVAVGDPSDDGYSGPAASDGNLLRLVMADMLGLGRLTLGRGKARRALERRVRTGRAEPRVTTIHQSDDAELIRLLITEVLGYDPRAADAAVSAWAEFAATRDGRPVK